MERLDTVIVGAGVVGLAVARSLALSGREVTVLEAEINSGQHCSSRNSGVIHAGLYYPPGSLKATLCVRGRALLYEYCDEKGIPCDPIGKLIVATSAEELATLAEIRECAVANGVNDLEQLSPGEAMNVEALVQCEGALYSPLTGIVDTGELMLSLQGDIEQLGGSIIFDSRVSNVHEGGDGIGFTVGEEAFACRTMINATSLWGSELVRNVISPKLLPAVRLAIGHYFSLPGKSPFQHLVYPVPSGGGLGIHATNDFGGAVRFGPDVAWTDDIDYSFDESCKPRFVAAIRKYYPELDVERLQPAFTGIRPRLSGPGQAAADFVIQTEVDHGVPGLVNLLGIDSPGLTASLAIADYVTKTLVRG